MDLIRICTAKIASVSPYSASRQHNSPKAHDKETHGELDARTWREKATTDADGVVCIPGMAFKQSLDNAATRLGMKVPGKRMATFTKHFRGGILVPDLVSIGVHKDALESVTISAHASGKRTDGTRVPRTFPIVRSWTATVPFYVIDAEISQEVFERHLREAGFFVGVGRFRPENGGTNGRFKLVASAWSEQTLDALMAA